MPLRSPHFSCRAGARHSVSDKVSSVRRVANLTLLAGSYAALFSEPHASSSYRAAMAGGALIVLAAALLTFSSDARGRLLAWPRATTGRIALAAIPWLGLVALVSVRGLWWTQRAVALRVFAL